MRIHFRVPPTNEGVAVVQLTYAQRLRLAPELAELVPILFKSAAAPCGSPLPPLSSHWAWMQGPQVYDTQAYHRRFSSIAQRRASSGVVMVAGPAAKTARRHRLLCTGAAHYLASQGGMFLYDRAPFKLVRTQVARTFGKRKGHHGIGAVLTEVLQQLWRRREFA